MAASAAEARKLINQNLRHFAGVVAAAAKEAAAERLSLEELRRRLTRTKTGDQGIGRAGDDPQCRDGSSS